MTVYTEDQAGRAVYLWWENLSENIQKQLFLAANRYVRDIQGDTIVIKDSDPYSLVQARARALFASLDSSKNFSNEQIAETLMGDFAAEKAQRWFTGTSEVFQEGARELAAQRMGIEPGVELNGGQDKALDVIVLRKAAEVVKDLAPDAKLSDPAIKMGEKLLNAIETLTPDDLKKELVQPSPGRSWHQRTHGGPRDISAGREGR